jgi:hypothetical protein
MDGHGKSDRPVVCAGRRMFLAGSSPVEPFQAGSVAKGGGNASPGGTGLGKGCEGEQVVVYGSGKWGRVRKRPGCALVACRLRVGLPRCLWLFLGLVAQDRAPTVRWGLKGLRRTTGP